MSSPNRMSRAEVLKQLDEREAGFESAEGDEIVKLLDRRDWHLQEIATVESEIQIRLARMPRRARQRA